MITLCLANQTARKSKVPGVISANIPGRLSLGVTEGIEAEIALPGTGIALDKIDQPGEFYSTMNSKTQPEHGNSPYLPDEVMYALNDSLEKKFGHHDYVITRDEIMAEFNGESNDGNEPTTSSTTTTTSTSKSAANSAETLPQPVTNKDPQDFDTAIEYLNKYPEWSVKQIESYNEAWVGKMRPNAPHKIPAVTRNAKFINFSKKNQVPHINKNGTRVTVDGMTPLAERAKRRKAYHEAYINARKKIAAMKAGKKYVQEVGNHQRRRNAGRTLSTTDAGVQAMRGKDSGVL